MMRRSAGFDADEARRQPLKEWQNVPALELTANDYITCRVNSVDLKNRLGDIETDCRDRLHVWLLRIVGALTAPTSMALPCRWRSRPQHQNRTLAPQQNPVGARAVVSGTVRLSALAVERRTHCDLGAIIAGAVQSFGRISTTNRRSGTFVLFCAVCARFPVSKKYSPAL